jgi:hypoxanthine phosphoribosyltransferase
MARPFGTIALAKAWAEARVPRRERPGRAVLVDRHGTVLAAEGLGVARSGPTVHQADAAGTTGPTLLALALEPEGRLHEMPVADPRAGSHTIERVVFSEEDLARRIEQLGREIAEAAPEDEEILLVGMLKGSFLFLADLARAIPRPVRLDFMVAASYHAGTVSSGEVTLKYEPDTSLKGRFVVIVEDIIDSGTTLSRLLPVFEAQEPAHLEVCALLHKRLVTLDPPARFVGFDAPPAFLVGYGLDFAEQFRNLPYIGVLQADEG